MTDPCRRYWHDGRVCQCRLPHASRMAAANEVTSHDLRLADAVIRELGLTHDCRYCGGWGPDHE